jgi:3-oxoacyl-[acyl-carrier protein] reductase
MSTSTTLSGKTALVTGGSRGIGAAIVRELARQGATVYFTYSASADAANKLVADVASAGGKAHALKADASSPAHIRDLFTTLDKHTPHLDILVNNAGVYLTANIAEFKDADYEKSFAVNVDGVYYTTREAVKRLRDNGRIVNIGSVVGEQAIGPGHSVYSATKFAVQGLTRGWARDLAGRKITVNVIQPGPIDTDMNPADAAKNPAADFFRSIVPLGRYGSPAEVASAVAFFASPAAAFISGSTLNIDGALIA